jgi:hypothetical protein
LAISQYSTFFRESITQTCDSEFTTSFNRFFKKNLGNIWEEIGINL